MTRLIWRCQPCQERASISACPQRLAYRKNTDPAVLDAPRRAGILSRNPHRMSALPERTVRRTKDSLDHSRPRLTINDKNPSGSARASSALSRIRRPTQPAQQRLGLVRSRKTSFLRHHPARLAFAPREQATNERPSRCPLFGPDKGRGILRFQSFNRRTPIRNRYSLIRYRHTRHQRQ